MTTADTLEPAQRPFSQDIQRNVRVQSLLGSVGRGMRLKVTHDESPSSDIVELPARKCFVGSAPICDVRVDEPGVADIECLIVHGAKHSVVRWLEASQDFDGGELFEDEILHVGDPLQIGPVELELLVDGTALIVVVAMIISVCF